MEADEPHTFRTYAGTVGFNHRCTTCHLHRSDPQAQHDPWSGIVPDAPTEQDIQEAIVSIKKAGLP